MRTRTKSIGLALAVVLLSAASGIGGVALANHSFSDVPDGSFFGPAINAGFESGCFTGFNDGTFRPNSNPTRGQFAFWTRNCGARASSATNASETLTDTTGLVTLAELQVDVGGSGTQQVHLTASMTASASGDLATTCGGPGVCFFDTLLLADGSVIDNAAHKFTKNVDGPQTDSISFTVVVPADAGVRTYELKGSTNFFLPAGSVFVSDIVLSAITVPFSALPSE